MTSKIEIYPERLKELREIAGYMPEDVAKKLRIPLNKFLRIEKDGKVTPAQLKKLAKLYRMPTAAFFSEKIPKIEIPVDYRINRDRKLTPEVFVAIRRAKYLLEQIKEISQKRSNIPEISTENPKITAKELRKYIGIEIAKNKSAREIYEYYKEKIEEKLNVLVMEYPLSDDVRGFSIYSDLSAIVLNESDDYPIKLFSLFHELAHLIRRESGICSVELEQEEKVEKFCNEFSAEFLVPEEKLMEEVKSKRLEEEKEVKKIAKKFGVSVEVIMLRLLSQRLISSERYKEFKEKFKKDKIIKKGRKDWEKTYINRCGNFAISEVSRAYKNGEITFYEAMRILDLNSKYAERILG